MNPRPLLQWLQSCVTLMVVAKSRGGAGLLSDHAIPAGHCHSVASFTQALPREAGSFNDYCVKPSSTTFAAAAHACMVYWICALESGVACHTVTGGRATLTVAIPNILINLVTSTYC